jgi:DNA polymerase-4
MHVDLNSCFAAIEQQANPSLRGRPVVVAAYVTSNGCILAASIEAKKLGIRTGMKVEEGKTLCPDLKVLPADPPKYRAVHLELKKLLSSYTDCLYPKSIDEFVLDLQGYPVLESKSMFEVAKEIKQRLKSEVGEALTVSIGISTNRYLAKVASNLHKPDGLTEINQDNYLAIYSKLKLTDLTGIKARSAVRLNSVGIYSVLDFCHSPLWKIKAAFHSICGYYWSLRLHGYEIDDFQTSQKSYGNSYALPQPFFKPEDLSPIVSKLVEKTGSRLRRSGNLAKGVHLAVSFKDGTFWHKSATCEKFIFDSRDIYQEIIKLLKQANPQKPVGSIAVSVFNLVENKQLQLEMFTDVEKKSKLTLAIDEINNRWGDFAVSSARMHGTEKYVPDRIGFGSLG